ncbi:MAG: pilus assembly protein [Chloroflexota bacterium]|nr:pilus assembly protein [Chloroflexota bacterium]MDE3194076.1 pilus assembly protein [Chloroflexota bacterium]
MKRLVARDDGTAIVEFSLLLPVLMLLILGLFDVSRAVWQENTLAYAAREGTRYAIVHGAAASPGTQQGPGNTAAIVNTVQSAAIGVPNVNVTVNYPDSGCYDRGCRVSVDARATFTPLGSEKFMNGVLSVTLRGGSLLVIQQ